MPDSNRQMVRSLGVSLLVLLVLALLGLGLSRLRTLPALYAGTLEAGKPGAFTLVMRDYRFFSDRMQWRTGEQVTLRIVNASQAIPGKDHEFMIGSTPALNAGPLGLEPGHGFRLPFFGDTQIEILEAKGLKMAMATNLKVSAGGLEAVPMNMGGPGPEGTGAAMPGMDMGGQGGGPPSAPQGQQMPGMEMPSTAGGGMAGMAMGLQMYLNQSLPQQERRDLSEEMGNMSGDNMFLLAPGGSVTLRFRVPDRPGLWQFGCFAGEGQHYLNGMDGTIAVMVNGGGL